MSFSLFRLLLYLESLRVVELDELVAVSFNAAEMAGLLIQILIYKRKVSHQPHTTSREEELLEEEVNKNKEEPGNTINTFIVKL